MSTRSFLIVVVETLTLLGNGVLRESLLSLIGVVRDLAMVDQLTDSHLTSAE